MRERDFIKLILPLIIARRKNLNSNYSLFVVYQLLHRVLLAFDIHISDFILGCILCVMILGSDDVADGGDDYIAIPYNNTSKYSRKITLHRALYYCGR